MCTIPGISNHFKRIDDVILTELIPAIIGDDIKINNIKRQLLSLPPKNGGLGIPAFEEECNIEFENLKSLASHLSNNIKNEQISYSVDPNLARKKNEIRNQRKQRIKYKLEMLVQELTPVQKKLLELNQEQGASSWLTTLPIKEENYMLTKACFRDLIRLRYGWELRRLSEKCECGVTFTIDLALSCKKGGFMKSGISRQKNLQETCHDVTLEPVLQDLSGEKLSASSNKADEARVDISVRGFWVAGQKAFLDVRVFNPLAKRYATLTPPKSYDANERERRRYTMQGFLKLSTAPSLPWYSPLQVMSRETRKLYKRLAEMLSDKRKCNYATAMAWLARKLSFALLRSMVTCIRGSRTTRRNEEIYEPRTSEEITSFRI